MNITKIKNVAISSYHVYFIFIAKFGYCHIMPSIVCLFVVVICTRFVTKPLSLGSRIFH